MRLLQPMLLFAILVSPIACDVSLEAQLNAEREKYDFLIPTLPSLDSALPTLGPASDIGSESTLITNWRTQAFYWSYALESLAGALSVREADTPLLVDLAAQRIVWGPYRDGFVDEWCVVSPLEDYNPDWTMGEPGQPFERSYGRLTAERLELLAEGRPWIQHGTRGDDLRRGLTFWDRKEMRLQEVYQPEENAPLRFDSMTYVYSDTPETALVSEVWIGLLNVVIPALNVTLPQFGATWGMREISERRIHHLVFAGVIDADGDGVAAEESEIRIGYQLDGNRIVAGRAEAFAATPSDSSIEGWALIECLGVGGVVIESYRVPVQRGAGDAGSALGAFSNQCREGFRSGLSTLNIPNLLDVPEEVLWLQSLQQEE